MDDDHRTLRIGVFPSELDDAGYRYSRSATSANPASASAQNPSRKMRNSRSPSGRRVQRRRLASGRTTTGSGHNAADMPDWATIASLATAGTTLVLAFATFASVRSGNRTARAAERSLLVNLRPLLAPSRLQDPPQKVGFADDHWVLVPGGCGVADVTDSAIYLVMSVRNSGTGIAVLHSWALTHDRHLGDAQHSNVDDFHRLTRDIYVPAGDLGFWQGAIREPGSAEFAAARDAIQARRRLIIELLYGDHEGGQRTISLFSLIPRDDGGWLASVARHWNIDRADPR
jgi:hypothetical protein